MAVGTYLRRRPNAFMEGEVAGIPEELAERLGLIRRPRVFGAEAVSPTVEGGGMLAPEPIYTRRRTVTEEAPTTRPRTVFEQPDRLTKLEETRAYHADQPATNDDPWWKNAGRMGLAGLSGGGEGGFAGLIGRFLGGAGVGLAMPDIDDKLDKARQLGELDRERNVEYTRRKAKLEEESTIADTENKRAQTEYTRRRPDLEADRIAGRSRDASARSLVSIYNRLPEFDPDAPENAELTAQMREAGLPVVRKQANQQLRFVQDARTGAWTVIAADKQTGAATGGAVTTPTGPLSTTSPQQVAAEEREKDRQLQERLTKMRITSAESIAAAQRTIQSDRLKMDREQFTGRYPGVGKPPIPLREIRQMAKDADMDEAEVVKDALGKGYVIEGMK